MALEVHKGRNGWVTGLTDTETGKTVKQGDRVRVGKSEKVWDVLHVFASGNCELHRQNPWKPGMRNNTVIYRKYPFEKLTIVEES